MSRTRRPNETALELLQRFDQALAQAISQGIFKNEISDGRFVLSRPKPADAPKSSPNPPSSPEARWPRNAGVVRNDTITRRQAPANIRDAVDSDSGINQSRHSRRIVPITRSQMTFIFGVCGAHFNTLIPSARIDSSRWLAKMLSRP
jgi:hypothetical protein